MIHVRVDDEELNSKRRFACGLGPDLPPGDVYFFPSEERKAGFRNDDVCPGCYPGGKPQIGIPISQLSGRPGTPGWEAWKAYCRSWGYD